MQVNPPRVGIESVAARLDAARTVADVDAMRDDVNAAATALARNSDMAKVHYLLHLQRVARTRAGDLSPDDDDEATVVPAEWVDELLPVLRINSTKLRIVSLQCAGRPSHQLLRLYNTTAGPVALFRAWRLDTAFRRDDFEMAPYDRVTHPPGYSAIVLNREMSATATFGAECRCNRQLLTVRHLRCAAAARTKHLSLIDLNMLEWKARIARLHQSPPKQPLPQTTRPLS